jgi:hypothetical protein
MNNGQVGIEICVLRNHGFCCVRNNYREKKDGKHYITVDITIIRQVMRLG